MPASERFKVSVTENSDNYKKYGSEKNVSGDDGVTVRLLPNSQDDSLQSAMETGLFITFKLSIYLLGAVWLDNVKAIAHCKVFTIKCLLLYVSFGSPLWG